MSCEYHGGSKGGILPAGTKRPLDDEVQVSVHQSFLECAVCLQDFGRDFPAYGCKGPEEHMVCRECSDLMGGMCFASCGAQINTERKSMLLSRLIDSIPDRKKCCWCGIRVVGAEEIQRHQDLECPKMQTGCPIPSCDCSKDLYSQDGLLMHLADDHFIRSIPRGATGSSSLCITVRHPSAPASTRRVARDLAMGVLEGGVSAEAYAAFELASGWSILRATLTKGEGLRMWVSPLSNRRPRSLLKLSLRPSDDKGGASMDPISVRVMPSFPPDLSGHPSFSINWSTLESSLNLGHSMGFEEARFALIVFDKTTTHSQQ
jgi:hypothetical protein